MLAAEAAGQSERDHAVVVESGRGAVGQPTATGVLVFVAAEFVGQDFRGGGRFGAACSDIRPNRGIQACTSGSLMLRMVPAPRLPRISRASTMRQFDQVNASPSP